jgi:hypothetical protein
MRVELTPFGVRVVNVVAGSIRSKFWENVAIPTIKEDSLYASVKKKAEESMSGGIVVDVHGCGMCIHTKLSNKCSNLLRDGLCNLVSERDESVVMGIILARLLPHTHAHSLSARKPSVLYRNH